MTITDLPSWPVCCILCRRTLRMIYVKVKAYEIHPDDYPQCPHCAIDEVDREDGM